MINSKLLHIYKLYVNKSDNLNHRLHQIPKAIQLIRITIKSRMKTMQTQS